MSRLRLAVRVGAVVAAPALVGLLVLFCISLRPGAAVQRGPLQGGGGASRTRGWLDASGFFPAEIDGNRSFSWMGDGARIRLPRLNRSVPYVLSLWVQPVSVDVPIDVTATVDGFPLPASRLVPGPQRIDIPIPARPSNRAVIALNASRTVVPGAADSRQLSMRVDDVMLAAADGGIRVPLDSVVASIVACVGLGVLIALTIGSGTSSIAIGAAAGGWFGFLLAYDGAVLGPYPDRLETVGIGAALVAGACALVKRRGDAAPWSWRQAVGLVALLTACKLALFLHPMVAVGDAIFHVHRTQAVQAGQYFFTSITPRPFFEFPYPPGLYVAVGPFWSSFRTEMEHVWLLRAAAIIVEGLLAIAIYACVIVNWNNRAVALLASVFCLLVPVGFYTLCTANLTNSFAQSLFGMGLLALFCAHTEKGWIPTAAGAALVCAAFLSHFSTFCTGLPLIAACALAAAVAGRGAPRRVAIALGVALAVAGSISVAVYYAHFIPVYRRTIERIFAREGEAAARSMVAPVTVKIGRAAGLIRYEFGLPILFGACWGSARLMLSRRRDPLTLGLAAWAIVVVGFWLLGVFTAIEMRASLAAQPLFAILLAVAVEHVWGREWWKRAAAVAFVGLVLFQAVADWCECVGATAFWRR
jgi:hypothetical protein